MKTLYLSDLEGTLLKSNQRISEFSVKVINAVIERGAFSQSGILFITHIYRKAHNKSQTAFLIHLS